MSEPLEVEKITKSYSKSVVLAGIDLRVVAGEILCILGVNGSGKTTLARIVAGLLTPDSGSVRIAGKEPRRRERYLVGITLPDAGWDQLHTARELLEMQCCLFGMNAESAKQWSKVVLEKLGLSSAADRKVRTYSFGMRRRLDFALAVAHKPPVLILDEPTNGIDVKGREVIWKEIQQQKEAGRAIMLFSQDLEEVERCADHVAFIVNGKLTDKFTPRQVRAMSGSVHLHLQLANPAETQTAIQVVKESNGENLRVRNLMGGRIEISAGADILNTLTLGSRLVERLVRAQCSVMAVSIAPPTLEQAVAQLI